MRKTKIICTLGPNAENYEILKQLADFMDVGRFNFSHGSYEEHKGKLELLKKVCEEKNKPIARLLDTKGPEIRTGNNENGGKITLVEGEEIIITTNECLNTNKKIYINYAGLINDIKEDNTILLDDGLMELRVVSKTSNEIKCKVIVGGELGEHKGVNVPGVKVNLPDLTDKDIEDIKFGIKEDFDIIAASFVRSASCIKQIRKILDENNSKMLIIAKIENEEGLKNLDDIIDEADGIMIARGDLGVEVKPYEVPFIQKEIIKKCNIKGKLVITATQMLDSMMRNPRPTRAEVADVANAIYDGTDAIMLSGETANGKYPIESVMMMDKIARETEQHISYNKRRETQYMINVKPTITTIVCKETVYAAENINAKCIIAPTNSGHTAQYLSKFKPSMKVYALTSDEKVCRMMMLSFAVHPILWYRPKNTDEIVKDAVGKLKEMKKVIVDDVVVLAFGKDMLDIDSDVKKHTNVITVEVVK